MTKISFGQRVPLPLTAATSVSTKQLDIKVEDTKVHHVYFERLQSMWQKAEELEERVNVIHVHLALTLV